MESSCQVKERLKPIGPGSTKRELELPTQRWRGWVRGMVGSSSMSNRFRWVYKIDLKVIQGNQNISTCNWLDLETLGSQPIYVQNLSKHHTLNISTWPPWDGFGDWPRACQQAFHMGSMKASFKCRKPKVTKNQAHKLKAQVGSGLSTCKLRGSPPPETISLSSTNSQSLKSQPL